MSNHNWPDESTSGPRTATLDLQHSLGRAVSVWLITDGKVGDVAPCLGVAERLGLSPEHRVVAPRAPWAWLMPWGPIDPRDRPDAAGSPLSPPFPDLAIGSGRRAVAYVRTLRRASKGAAFTVLLKDPRTAPSAADLIWVPEHDRLRGDNVVTTLTTPHRISPERLARLRRDPPPEIDRMPQPRVAVLLGGPSGDTHYSTADFRRLADGLRSAGSGGSASFLVTPSRRTPPMLMSSVEAALSSQSARIWRGEGENPYFAFLALADVVVVTGDSVNMVSEALATGRPVLIFRPVHLSSKLESFLGGIERCGWARPFQGKLERFEVEPVDSTPFLAAEILRRMVQRAEGARRSRFVDPPGTLR